MDEFTVEDNFYTRLGLPLGASVEDVEAAFARLAIEATDSEDPQRWTALKEARDGLTYPGLRSLHNQRIKWAAAAVWYHTKFPDGHSAEEHHYWAEFRRQAVDDDPGLWERVKDVIDGEPSHS